MPGHRPHSDPVLLFLHIPKTAGKTLINSVLYRHYASHDPNEVCYVPLGIMRDPSLSPPYIRESSKLRNRSLRVVVGHFPFGMHEFISRSCAYVSFLRDPIDRVISLYYHILRYGHEPLHDRLIAEKVGLDDFVSNISCREAENDQTRRLAGLDVKFNESDSRMLALAKGNIRRHFAFVGITERFDESLILLKRQLDWQDVRYIPELVNEHRPRRESLSSSTLDLIAKYNALDIELYDYANNRLDELVRNQDSDFEEELHSFSLANARYKEAHRKRP